MIPQVYRDVDILKSLGRIVDQHTKEFKPSKGHYGTWLGDGQKVSYQEQLRQIIDTVPEEKPTDFSDFPEKLKSCGVTVNTDRNNLRLKVPGQTKFTRFNELSAEIKDLESQMTANAELQKQIVNYAKTRAIYAEYRKAGYSKKFREAHESDILIHQAAKKYFDSLGTDQPLSVKALRGEYSKLLARKRKAYAAYKQAREEMKELYNIKSNVEHLLNIDEREIERDREKEQR